MKVIDITEKLNFAEKPKIRIKDTEITVNNSASAMLRIIPKISKKSIEPSDMTDIIDLLIVKGDRAKLDALELDFEDLMIFVEAAVSLVTGDDSEGETQTRTTT